MPFPNPAIEGMGTTQLQIAPIQSHPSYTLLAPLSHYPKKRTKAPAITAYPKIDKLASIERCHMPIPYFIIRTSY